MGTFSVWHWLVVVLLGLAAYGIYRLIRPRDLSDLVGVRGWLRILVLGLMCIGPVTAIIQTSTVCFLLEYEEPALRNLSAWREYKTTIWLVVAVASALSFYAGLGLTDRKRDYSAVKRAKIIVWIIGPVVTLVAALVSHAYLKHVDGLSVVGKLIGSAIGAAVWSAYLSRSRRVKATYGSEAILGPATPLGFGSTGQKDTKTQSLEQRWSRWRTQPVGTITTTAGQRIERRRPGVCTTCA